MPANIALVGGAVRREIPLSLIEDAAKHAARPAES